MEERRGESSDVWMAKAGDEGQFYLEEDVRALGQAYFQGLGIDLNLSDSAKITRHAELKSGIEQTPEEYERALAFLGSKAEVFHALLKHRLGQ